MHYGKAIRLLRRSKGLSQRRVAALLSITQQAYSKLEKREWLNLEKIKVILNCLESSMAELELARKLTTDK
jgi:transcriptional regulator with XRE-family HTH domain